MLPIRELLYQSGALPGDPGRKNNKKTPWRKFCECPQGEHSPLESQRQNLKFYKVFLLLLLNKLSLVHFVSVQKELDSNNSKMTIENRL